MLHKFMFEVPRIKEDHVLLLLEIIKLKCIDDPDYKMEYESYRTSNVSIFCVIYEIRKKDKINEEE